MAIPFEAAPATVFKESDIAEFGLDTVEGVAEGLSYVAVHPVDFEALGKVNGEKDDGEKNS